MSFIDLSRRFRDLTQDELESPELLASLNEHSLRWADGWSEILQCPRVVLLAEAGSGKTIEMREQAVRLVAAGKPAFCIALESLDRELLLKPDDERSLFSWKADGQSTAWFLLDAADELKLTGGRLERALARLRKAIDGSLHRAHVVISCRPSDWRPSIDMVLFKETLPIRPVSPVSLSESEELFLDALRRREGGRATQRKPATVNSPRVVVLLPLGERQIATLASELGVSDTAAFVSELHKRGALPFARRPLDLIELIQSWKTTHRLGTRAEQHAINLAAKLRDDPERTDRGLMSDEYARSGAERLALALILTRTRTIRSPEQALELERSEGVLDPAKILTDWTEEQRQSLLRRALFDPATYGRVRFHHRSVQEYLAAQRLHALRKVGMPARRLNHLLFAELYGTSLVIPSMQAVAAWLALWDLEVRRELMAREPETLLSMGDPESLPIPERAQLLRAFASAYGEGGWRGLHIPIHEVRKLAHPDLASVVRDLWGATPTNPDVAELLLEVICHGPIQSCADIARAAAFDFKQSEYHRVVAVTAMVACGKEEDLCELAASIVYEPAKWPDWVVHQVVGSLFPVVIGVSDLIALIERTPEPENSAGGFAWVMKQIVETIEPLSDLAKELRDRLADLVWRTRYDQQDWYRLKAATDHIAPALARLCDRQLRARDQGPVPDSPLIWACVVANRFGTEEVGAVDAAGDLRKHFAANPSLRQVAFWSEIKLTSEAVPTGDANDRLFHAEARGLLDRLTADDYPWLIDALRNPPNSESRAIALRALSRLWILRGRRQPELDELAIEVCGDSDLTEILRQRTAPPEPDPKLEKLQLEHHQRELEEERRKDQRLLEWSQWRTQLLDDPREAFNQEMLSATRWNLLQWLRSRDTSRTRYNAWDEEVLIAAFGARVGALAATAFQEAWRANPPEPRSSRPPEKRNSILAKWIEGLTGLSVEAKSTGWAARLTQDEAQVAAVYATIEMNGFPDWLEDLAAAHPEVVHAVIDRELRDEVTRKEEHSWTLQSLSHAGPNVKRLFVGRCLVLLSEWKSSFQNDESPGQSDHQLAEIIGILDEVGEGSEQACAAELCRRHFSECQGGPLALAYLRGLLRFDPEGSTQALEDSLASMPSRARRGYATKAFAGLFGHRDTVLRFPDNEARAKTLGRLIRCAYRYVRPADDQEHEGVYSPDTRDLAQRARDSLLSSLLDTPGAGTQKVLRELESLFAHYRDHLRLLARRRASSDAERPALTPEDIVALEERYEAPLSALDGLFVVMLDRLDDLAHDIAHHDFSDRRTLQGITDESEMQRTLAFRLEGASKNIYVVSREEEVADCKRTDIRLTATRGDHRAVIEVKLADRWSLAELERALRDQLVGQYLRHASSRFGCLLLVYRGKKEHWRHPQTAKQLSFPKLVGRLTASARAIEHELAEEAVRLAVFPLDLTEPRIATETHSKPTKARRAGGPYRST